MYTDFILFDIGKKYFNNINYKKIKIFQLNNYKKSEIVVVQGNSINRDILENNAIDILLSPEYGIKKDSLHFRSSGLNKVLCNLAKKNDIAIGFSFSELLNSNDKALLLGRMMQNVRLCRKFRVKMILATFAKNEYELRSPNTLKSFGLVIGMTPLEVKKAFDNSNNLTNLHN